MSATLVYRSEWSKLKPLVYSDDSCNSSVNSFLDKLLKTKMKTGRLINKDGKYYYCPSDEYKKYVMRMRKIK